MSSLLGLIDDTNYCYVILGGYGVENCSFIVFVHSEEVIYGRYRRWDFMLLWSFIDTLFTTPLILRFYKVNIRYYSTKTVFAENRRY